MLEELDCRGLRVGKRYDMEPNSAAAGGIRGAVEFTD